MENYKNCPKCQSELLDESDNRVFCTECGLVLEESTIRSEVTFTEGPSGARSADGQFVDERGSFRQQSGVHEYTSSRQRVFYAAQREIGLLSDKLNVRLFSKQAVELYLHASRSGFVKGRRSLSVMAVALYIICRIQQTSHLLLDFADAIQTSVYQLGSIFLKLRRKFHITDIKIVDPSLFIQRFASKLEFEKDSVPIGNTALRIITRMKRDFIQVGRRPAGVCGAALFIAGRIHGYERDVEEIAEIVCIGSSTIQKRLVEFTRTHFANIKIGDFLKMDINDILKIPPSNPPACLYNKIKKKRERERKKKMLIKKIKELTQLKKGARLQRKRAYKEQKKNRKLEKKELKKKKKEKKEKEKQSEEYNKILNNKEREKEEGKEKEKEKANEENEKENEKEKEKEREKEKEKEKVGEGHTFETEIVYENKNDGDDIYDDDDDDGDDDDDNQQTERLTKHQKSQEEIILKQLIKNAKKDLKEEENKLREYEENKDINKPKIPKKYFTFTKSYGKELLKVYERTATEDLSKFEFSIDKGLKLNPNEQQQEIINKFIETQKSEIGQIDDLEELQSKFIQNSYQMLPQIGNGTRSNRGGEGENDEKNDDDNEDEEEDDDVEEEELSDISDTEMETILVSKEEYSKKREIWETLYQSYIDRREERKRKFEEAKIARSLNPKESKKTKLNPQNKTLNKDFFNQLNSTSQTSQLLTTHDLEEMVKNTPKDDNIDPWNLSNEGTTISSDF
ncbi:transcription factor iiib 90 kda subunit [Anaeramoeba flamelloides]|uniref:B-related factor 1 n=1 Tax=Anaeramoeba flamelloides TaxID=1746091 RepID=A0ABQ8XXE2_9EUKA|nr:transcription factor iiib 90 kda subunit [Anaeramoeba flamelloides]